MEWTVHELAGRAGISGRTLRHYHQIGLLEPDRIGHQGYRYYGPTAVARLQRILLLRDTGMTLADIAAVVDRTDTPDAEADAIATHLDQLREAHHRLTRRIAAVEHALAMRREGREPRMDVMLDGFNDRYEAEVVDRWGQEAFDASHQWWHRKSVAEQQAWKARAESLLARWRAIHENGLAVESREAAAHVRTHLEWFSEIPGTPAHDGNANTAVAMVHGMADQYEQDPDFHVAFGTAEAARFAAGALRLHTTEEFWD
ncbi:MerR family transcriptional regulator [Demequina sp. B12]|uniref:MerR family transcriptional regulator n=1 Tax=Demequina sp. B12 TaxID=2992757 RepID=UPI00237B506F|nr:MerR family transcriptional regulator [Demequina sp. B12]MDE0572609.1 MerR family transcriptional regulator [Demequina sp. B12]